MEKEIDNLLIFIGDFLDSIDISESKKLKDFAELCGVRQENLTRYRQYGKSTKEGERHDPHLRTFYKILRGTLSRAPISLNDSLELQLHKFKAAQELDKFGILGKILEMILFNIDLTELSGIIDVYYKRIDISPQKTGESS